MWLPQSALERIRELEALLRESVPQGVYQGALARIAELEQREAAERAEHARQLRWFSSMLLRRAGSMPLPPTPEEKAEAVKDEPPPLPSETAIAQAEAIIMAGRAAEKGREEIERAVTAQTGLTGADLAALMRVM